MKSIEQIALEIAQEIGESYSCEDGEYVIDPIDFATKFLEAWQAQQLQEAVAWACFAENGNIRIWKSAPPDDVVLVKENGIELIPLFLAPPPAIPDHMCLVPKEPSEAILNVLRGDECNITTIYKAMLKAAQGGKE